MTNFFKLKQIIFYSVHRSDKERQGEVEFGTFISESGTEPTGITKQK